jgi:O-antigen ligase
MTRSFSIRLLVVHLFVLACFGQYYAKLRILDGAPVFTTDLVLLVGLVASFGALTRMKWDRFSKLVLAFVLVGVAWAVSTGLGPMDGAGPKAFSFFVYAGFYFIVRAAAPSDESLWRLLQVFAMAAVIAVVIGLLQMQRGAPLFGGGDFETTTTGSIRWLPGEFSLYALFAALVIAVPAIVERRIDARRIGLLALAAAELILTQHRSGFVSLAVALVATAGLLGNSTEALKGLLKLLVVAALGIAVFAWVFGGSYIDETVNRIAHSGDLSDANIDWRLLSWYEVFEGVRDRPWGHGFATWDFLFTSSDPLTGSHNDFLDLAYRIGVGGLLVFLAMPVLLMRDVRRLARETGARTQSLLVTVCAAMIAFLLFSAFNVVLESPQMSIVFWVLLGIGGVALERRQVSALRHDAGESGPSSATT